jgi:cytoskeleton-associated protein 5
MPAVVDKCFGSSRQGTKQKGIALALEYIEVENSGEGVVVRTLMILTKDLPYHHALA